MAGIFFLEAIRYYFKKMTHLGISSLYLLFASIIRVGIVADERERKQTPKHINLLPLLSPEDLPLPCHFSPELLLPLVIV